MKRSLSCSLFVIPLLAALATTARAADVNVNSILSAQRSGATTDGIMGMVNDPGNTISMTAEDVAPLRAAGVAPNVIGAIWTRIPAPAAPSFPFEPDDKRLVEVVGFVRSGMTEPLIADRVRQGGHEFLLSGSDLAYLKQNAARESTLAALMAAKNGAPAGETVDPSGLSFDGLVLVRPTFLRKDREGKLLLKENRLMWLDRDDARENFTFEVAGLEKVWFTCEARSPDNFCYQINFKIVKGDRYRFRDTRRDAGSNGAVTSIMDALRLHYPRIVYAAPSD
jgi:hypothetical protein